MNKNTDLDDQIEELYREISKLKDTGGNDKFVKIANENKTLNDKLKNSDERNIESNDIIVILESTLKNREDDVERMKIEIVDLKCENQKIKFDYELKEKANDVLESDEDRPSTSKCGKCDYESDDEVDLKMHMDSHHETRCNICDHKCLNKFALESHIEKTHRTKGDESESNDVGTSQ